MKERKSYTAEFKREAVKLMEQPGIRVEQIASDLGVSVHSLYEWRKKAQEQGELAFPGNGRVALTAEQEENRRLKRELELVKQERDILKKTIAYFARTPK
jgi:transposase-like protein